MGLDRLFADGRIAEYILVLMVVEAAGLILIRRHGWLRVQPLEFLVSLGAGAGLLLALRAAMRADGWPAIALWLLAALGCHLWDLKLRWTARRVP